MRASVTAFEALETIKMVFKFFFRVCFQVGLFKLFIGKKKYMLNWYKRESETLLGLLVKFA